MTEEPLKLTEGSYGFAWGPLSVTRRFSHEGRVAISVETDTGQELHIYASRTGRSLRVFRDGRELLPTQGEERTMSEQKRGRCPVCDRDMLLKKDGTLRHHGGPVGSGIWDDYRSYRCAGAGERPVPAQPTDEQWKEATS